MRTETTNLSGKIKKRSRIETCDSIPQLRLREAVHPLYWQFLQALRASAFGGEIRTDHASRLVVGRDNSIYQMTPQAVVFPRSGEEVSSLATLANQSRFQQITFSSRGGRTEISGQLLYRGIVMDLSKYLTRILATGHSCRSQVQRFDGFTPRHPTEMLLQALLDSSSPSRGFSDNFSSFGGKCSPDTLGKNG